MRQIAYDISKTVVYRKKARFVNRLIMANELGEDNLAFIVEAVKEVEWDTVMKEPEDDCDCFGCQAAGSCEKIYYRYKLNLETMDLARNIPEDNSLFEYIDFGENAEEIDGALMVIWIALDCFREE